MEGVGFGNYRLLRRLARGGMAEVFLARQQGVEGFERRVAIKRILPHLSDSTEFRTMFLDEARLAAQLSHPNIIHIYDFGKVEDYFYIAMEYVEGVDLGRLIKQARNTPVPFALIARTLADICAGLHYAHNITDNGKRLNVVHRDVTPQNVLITYDGIVKVVDFGIAKATWQASRTRPGVVKGKYAYMSPEQVEGRALDARSDVFSVGICMYELMTGMPLFRRDNVVEAMKEIRDGKPIHPEQFRADIPPELAAVLKKALETSRDQRYATAAAMQLDLERYLKGATELATPQLLGDFLRREAPQVSQGELLAEGEDGEMVVVQKPKTPSPVVSSPLPVPTSAAVKGGTAPISNVKQAVTPAYDNAANLIGSSPSHPPVDQTTPGKHVRAISKTAEPSLGFADQRDDDQTRKDTRMPEAPGEPATTRSPKLTPPAGSASQVTGKSGQHDRPAGKSGQRIPSYPGSPLGSYPPESEPRTVLSNDPTTMSESPPVVPPRSRALVWILLILIGAAGGVFAVRRWAPTGRDARVAVDLAPSGTLVTRPEAAADLSTIASPARDAAAPTDAATVPKVVTTALPVQTSASIGIYTRPTGARVFIDGQQLDALTPVRMQPVTSGPHHVVIERVGFQPREIDVSLAVSEHRVLDFELPSERSLQPGKKHPTAPGPTPTPTSRGGSGFLTAKTEPWSRAFEGTRLLGETPVVNVPLSEGPHTITFVNPSFPPVKKNIVIKVGEETKLKFSLQEP